MEGLGTSVLEEPSVSETQEKIQKSIDLLMMDYEERKRSGLTGGARYRPEYIPAQTEATALLPPLPSPGDESRDRSGDVSAGDKPGVSSIANV